MRSVRAAVALLGGVLGCIPASARAQESRPADLVRTHYTVESGLPGSVVDEIVQTGDGFLWLVTGGVDLVRFDGRRFHRFSNVRPFTVAAAPDGDLWVGTRRGLLRVPASSFDRSELASIEPYHPDPGNPRDLICIRVARDGVVWIGTAGGLYRYDGTQSVSIGPRVPILAIEIATDGHAWGLTPAGVFEIAGPEVRSHPDLPRRLGVGPDGIFHILKDRGGNTWYSTAKGLARETAGRIEQLETSGGEDEAAFRSYEDASGTVWVGTRRGLSRGTSTGLNLLAEGMQVRALFADRDGNVWVGTNGDGLYRFRVPSVRMYAAADGLPKSPIMTVITARDGTIWTGANCGGLSRFNGRHFETFDERHGLLNSCVYALTEDRNGALWIGTWGGGAFQYHNGRFFPHTMKQGMPHDRITSIVVARDDAVWFGTNNGLARLKDRQLRVFTTKDGLSRNAIYRVFEDRQGVIWAASRDGLDHLVGDRFENYTALPKSHVVPIGEDREGGFFVQDLVKPSTLRLASGRMAAYSQFASPMHVIETQQGELWFGGNGITRVPAGQFGRLRQNDEPLDYETFSVADGLATAEVSVAGQRTLSVGHDGAVWAATPQGLVRFEPDHLATAPKKTRIYLTEATIGRNTVPAGGDILLPAGTSHVRIGFSAIELSSPEKIRMQYRLEGVDSEWLDAARDPYATYSTLPPGRHTLRIRATDRSGVWDRDGVTFTIVQRPFFYQTGAFAALITSVAVLAIFGIYRLRVRHMARGISARYDERLAERTRVARELHDTFLQTVQGSKMVADHALKDTGDHTRMIRAMEQLSVWLDQATREGRAALNSLRSSTTERNDLAEAFRRATDECRQSSRAELSFSVHGQSRELHPVARDEVYRIGYEALRNACMHAGAAHIQFELRYAQDLIVRVADDGVGIEPSVAEGGKGGHFGLQGMRERARRIGATLALTSSPGTGTLVVLTAPGRIMFAKPETRRVRWPWMWHQGSSRPSENHRSNSVVSRVLRRRQAA